MSSKLLEEWKKRDPRLLDIEGFQKFLDERGAFKDIEFMSAEEKKKVLRDWKRFLKAWVEKRVTYRHFTKRLYNYLHQHCSYIAHYSRGGFFNYYFADATMTPTFFKQWDTSTGNQSSEMHGTWWLRGDYEDLNKAMIEEFEEVEDEVLATITKRKRSWMWEMGQKLLEETRRV